LSQLRGTTPLLLRSAHTVPHSCGINS
jgi:hypothetical protein